MKKWFILILAAALAFTSCKLDETIYTLTNVNNYLNYDSGVLTNDAGLTLNVTEDNTDGNWKIDGNRFFGTFDVLNVNYDITMKSYMQAILQNPKNMPTDVGEEGLHGDPVSILDCTLGGIYLNLIVGFYAKPGTDCPHDMQLYWSDDHSTLSLVLVHEGNGENSVEMDEKDLKSLTRVYCFPIHDLVASGEQRTVTLTVDALGQMADGTYVSQPYTAYVYNGPVKF